MNRPLVRKGAASAEFFTPERCFITELWNHDTDSAVSVAQARVEPGVVTEHHRLNVDERYLVTAGEGRVEVEGLDPQDVSSGDVVLIPAQCAQRVTNTGRSDLVFLCICTPRFDVTGYQVVHES